MGYKAQWGPMGFIVSPDKIVPFENLTTSITLKSDNGNDTSGTSPTNVRGREPQPMSFSTKYMRALGVDPRERFEAWSALVGQSYPLYIGDQRFGPAKMMLTGINMSELITSNTGVFLSVKLDITMQEDTTSATKTTKSSSKKKASSTSKAGSTYAKTVEKKKAMKATASKDDKAAKMPRAYKAVDI